MACAIVPFGCRETNAAQVEESQMKCFVIMPFRVEFDDVYAAIKSAVSTAILGDNVECFRLDDNKAPGSIFDELAQAIEQSTLCVADLTGNNANVMWEVGYAMALKKPTILLTQNIENQPFDLKMSRAIPYTRESLAKTLGPQLAEAVRHTLTRYEVRRETIRSSSKRAPIYAITGSTTVDEPRCRRRLDAICAPLLSPDATWLCGSFGAADECAADYLLSNKQRIQIVGYGQYDFSAGMLELMKRYDVPFVDAQKEQLAEMPGAPSERDKLFIMKADMLIALWNGHSQGAKGLIEWYAKNKKDYVVGFA